MRRQRFLNIVLILIAVIALSLGGYFYYRLHTIQMNSAANIQKEADDLLSHVARIALIPAGEEPTIATVSDPNKLKGQAFFKQAQKGDKVIIFSTAGRAVLYRPSIDKIVEIMSITSPTTNDQNTATPSQTSETTSLKDKGF